MTGVKENANKANGSGGAAFVITEKCRWGEKRFWDIVRGQEGDIFCGDGRQRRSAWRGCAEGEESAGEQLRRGEIGGGQRDEVFGARLRCA